MSDDDKVLAEHIASARKNAGLSQEALSEKLYVTRQAVSNWERGRTRPSQEMVEKIAGALGVGVEHIVGVSIDVGRETMEKEELVMEQKKIKKAFSRQSILIGLGYAIGFFLGFTLFFVTGLLVMQPMVWAAALFGGIGVFFLVGLTIHFIILWKSPSGQKNNRKTNASQ